MADLWRSEGTKGRHTIFISVVVFRVFSIEAEWVIFSIG